MLRFGLGFFCCFGGEMLSNQEFYFCKNGSLHAAKINGVKQFPCLLLH